MKKVILITLILSVILSTFGAMAVFAMEQGKCGDNLSWTFDGETVTISGTGNMYNYDLVGDKNRSPWAENLNIKYVVINNGVNSIGKGAFASCDGLINVSIPNSIDSIGEYAFASCKNLTNIKLPSSLKNIGRYAFTLCSSVKDITIPGSVKKIEDDAFGCSGLKNVVIADGVQIVAKGAFEYCAYLKNVAFPNSIISIETDAFKNCYNLKKITIPKTVNIADGAFDSNVVISYQGNTSIFSQASITVTLNGTYINFDVQPTEINGRVLVPVRAIFEALGAKVVWNEGKNEVVATKGDVTIRLYKDNTTMYRNDDSITLDVPAKDIGDRILVPVRAISEAFGCKVDWSDVNSQVIITTGNEPKNEASLLKCGENLTYIHNGNTIEISGKGEMYRNFYAFNDTLENVIINEGVTNISESCFARCTNLKSVNLPSTLKRIEDSAFRGCSSLQDIKIPEGVISIGKEAFWECESLRSLTIPESVKAIGSDAFSFCTNLKEVKILGEIKIDKKDIFYRSDNVIIVEKNNSNNFTQYDNPFDVFATYIMKNGEYKQDDGRYCITYKVPRYDGTATLYCQHSPIEGTIQIQSAFVDNNYNVTTQVFTIYEIGDTYKSICIMIIPEGTLIVNANERPENIRDNYTATISSYDFEEPDGTKLSSREKIVLRDAAISTISNASLLTVTLLEKYLLENRSLGLSVDDLGFINF